MVTLQTQSSIQEKASLRPAESAHQGPPHESQQKDKPSTQPQPQPRPRPQPDSEDDPLDELEAAQHHEPPPDTQSNQITPAVERGPEGSAASSTDANKKRKRKGKEKEKDNKKPKKQTKKQTEWDDAYIKKKMKEWKGRVFELDKHETIGGIRVVGDKYNHLVKLQERDLSKELMKDIITFNTASNAAVRACFLLGEVLQAAKKNPARRKIRWASWYNKEIKPECGLSLSYIDQLRRLYVNLHAYPGLQALNIATHHLVRHSSAIRKFLEANRKWRKHWKNKSSATAYP